MRYAIYYKESGVVKMEVECDSDMIDMQIQDNEAYVEIGSPLTYKKNHVLKYKDGSFVNEEVPLSPQQKIKQVEKAVQRHLDDEARKYGYDSILSACSYAGYGNPFQLEGQSFILWRGNVWKYCYDQLAKIESGEREEPTLEDFLEELPAYTPPS